MNTTHLAWIGLALVFGGATARAADAPPAPNPPPAPQAAPADSADPSRDLEPAVNTSVSPAPTSAAKPDTAPAPAAKPAARKSEVAKSEAARPAAAKSPGKVMDRLNLDETQVTGNSELPKVLYIVPWKRADLGDLDGKPMNSLLDEVLTPIDRDVFRRENRYYDALEAEQTAPDVQGARDEK